MVIKNQIDHCWRVINQAHSPQFQEMIARLADDLGPCLMVSGRRHDVPADNLTVIEGPRYDRRAPIHRVSSWLTYAAFTWNSLKGCSGKPFTLVVTNPPILPHLAWRWKRTRGIPYGILVWDLYLEGIIALGRLRQQSIASTVWRNLDALALRDADVIITLGDRMAETIRRKLPKCSRDRAIEVIPNWADTESIRPQDKSPNPFAVAHQQVGKITLIYSGNIGASHNLKPVVEAARKLQHHDRISFLIIGDGLGEAQLRSEIQGLSNAQMLPRQSWHHLPRTLATGDIAFVVQEPNMEGITMPSKTYSHLAAGSAILAVCNESSDLARLVTTQEVGEVVPRFDSQQIAEKILSLTEDEDRLARYRSNARRVAEEQYSFEVVRSQLHRVLSGRIEQRD